MLKLDINLLFTVINLVVWYLLIKKFLFKPVNNIISKREEAIADRYREAEQEKVQAGEQKQKYEALQSSIQDEKTKVMQKAQEDAREAYRQIVDEANRKAGEIMEDSRKTAELEHTKMVERAEKEIRSLLFEAASEGMQKKDNNSELYDKFARINSIDQAIYESEQEVLNGAEATDANIVFEELEKKHFG